MVPECKPEWNREAIMVSSRLPSLMAADKPCPQLQPSLDKIVYHHRKRHCIIESENLVYGTTNRNFLIIWRNLQIPKKVGSSRSTK